MMKYIISMIYLMATSIGILLMKLGGDSFHVNFKGDFSFKMGYITLLGFISYAISFLLWQKLVTLYELSTIVPILTGIVQIIIFLMAIFIFKENINLYNILGIILLIVGIVFLSIRK